MEHVISAPHDGTVTELDVAPGSDASPWTRCWRSSTGRARLEPGGTAEEEHDYGVPSAGRTRRTRTGVGQTLVGPPGELPMAVPAQGLPARVRIHEVGARDGLQNEKTVVPTEVKAEFIAPAGRRRADAPSRRPASCTPSGCPNSPTPSSCSRCSATWPGRRAPASSCRTSAASTGRSALGARPRSRCSPAPPSPSPRPTSTARSTSRSPCSSRSSPAPGRTALHVRGYLSMCFGDPWEGPVPVAPGGRRRQGPDGPGLPRAEPRRHHRRRPPPAMCGRCSPSSNEAGVPTGAIGGALPRHLRPGPVQHPRRPPARRDHRGRLGRRPRRLPVRQERHRQPRHRGPGVDARTASASRPASTSAGSPPPASGWPSSWAAPAPPAPYVPVPHHRGAP